MDFSEIMSGLTTQERLSSMTGARQPLVHLGSGMKLKSEAILQPKQCSEAHQFKLP